MNDKYIEKSTSEEIVETQEESEEDDEVTFRFFVNGKIVSWAKTILYSCLKELCTSNKERRKGYCGKLLSHIEKISKARGAISMRACYADSWSDEAAVFFRRRGYVLNPVENDMSRFLEAIKKL